MNGGGMAVMGEHLSREERDLVVAVEHNCGCTPPRDETEAQGWRHKCSSADLLNERTLARLSALRREAETREWGGET